MTSKIRTVVALATAVALAAGTAAIAQTAAPDAKPPVKKTVKHHAHKSAATPASDMYLRAAGSEPAPKASK
jgi:hypothetical protein